ncbi:hypothetical protein [Bradyrhizobium sp. Ce-3]|uniref:hypothetical protein n=1 Tax=Bradyrhizobium sp. Ce-3 TaxID=2913970 RepID=UPI001FC81265|nr:hypothetical protein [Bradyrhizobium sp. Ce-3]
MAYSIEKASPFIARTNDYARCRQGARKKIQVPDAGGGFDLGFVARLGRLSNATTARQAIATAIKIAIHQ